MNATDGEKAAAQQAEGLRRSVAAVCAAASVILAVAFYFGIARQPESGWFSKALLAALLSIAIVTGARSLEGPARAHSQRRNAIDGSDASPLIRLWLSCFVALSMAFLAGEILERFAPQTRAPAQGTNAKTATTSPPPADSNNVTTGNGQ